MADIKDNVSGPKHVGFIMDGNGRWATNQGLPRIEGYKEGVIALVRVIKACADNPYIKAVTMFALSTENLDGRCQEEIDTILTLVERFNNAYEGNCVVTYMGDTSSFSDTLQQSIEDIEQRTANNSGIRLNIALNYGARQDIIRAAKLCHDHLEFVEDAFESRLSSSHLPPLDLIVRTGGQKRLSNFMLYEGAYAELIFMDKLWPDMGEFDVGDCVREFISRQRNFGK